MVIVLIYISVYYVHLYIYLSFYILQIILEVIYLTRNYIHIKRSANNEKWLLIYLVMLPSIWRYQRPSSIGVFLRWKLQIHALCSFLYLEVMRRGWMLNYLLKAYHFTYGKVGQMHQSFIYWANKLIGLLVKICLKLLY